MVAIKLKYHDYTCGLHRGETGVIVGWQGGPLWRWWVVNASSVLGWRGLRPVWLASGLLVMHWYYVGCLSVGRRVLLVLMN